MLDKIGQRYVWIPTPFPRPFRRLSVSPLRVATHTSRPLPRRPPLRPERPLTGLFSQILTQVGDWWTPSKEEITEVLHDDTVKAQFQKEIQKTVPEVEKQLPEISKKISQPNILQCLNPVPVENIQYMRRMAWLANATYFIPRQHFGATMERLGFELLTTSYKCKELAKGAKLIDEAAYMGDGMAVSAKSQDREEVLSNIVATTDLHDRDSKIKRLKTGNVAGAIYSQTLAQLARQLSTAATVSQSAVTDSITNVMRLLQAAIRSSPKSVPLTDDKGGVTPHVLSKCPNEWFVCDDKNSDTRFFCVQGTETLGSWQLNLKFDPVVFEDENLGILVHRGIYEAAKGLYKLFVPLVREHIESGNGKKISLVGHSLGGGLATVVMIMMVLRGDLPVENVGRVFTFGGASTFCEHASGACPLDLSEDPPMSDGLGLLEHLGLQSDAVVNVIMHKDIVPRAFACDYSLVADFLKNWNSSFKKHGCLSLSGRALLWDFVGEVHILQPHEDCHFVCKEGYHSMLPNEAGLYKLVRPDHHTQKLNKTEIAESSGIDETEVCDRRTAFAAFMDHPHPLDILSDPGAYGVHGAISRYHNPLNYIKGLRSVIVHTKKTRNRLGFFKPSLLPF